MARYIDAEKLKEAFSTDTQHIRDWDVDLYDLFMTEIDEQPTADVQEVKHGKWEYDMRDGVYQCSQCENITSSASVYCGKCGAKMDKEREENA